MKTETKRVYKDANGVTESTFKSDFHPHVKQGIAVISSLGILMAIGAGVGVTRTVLSDRCPDLTYLKEQLASSKDAQVANAQLMTEMAVLNETLRVTQQQLGDARADNERLKAEAERLRTKTCIGFCK